jgi:hypothetical protein
VALAWAKVGRGLFFPFFGKSGSSPPTLQSLGGRFLIVCVEDGYEFLVRDSLGC